MIGGMPDVVYLHVGAPKTGTTYLQDRLHRNRRALAAHGVQYPVGRQKDMFGPALDLLQMSFDGELDSHRGSWDALVRRVRSSSGRVIVSHELFAGASPDQASRAVRELSGPELHVVYSIRDLARQIPAVWQESLKHRKRKKFKRFVREVRRADRRDPTAQCWRFQSVPDVLGRWCSQLPPERVHLVTVPAAEADAGELWRRYCAAFGVDPGWAPEDSHQRNSSMGIEEAAVARALNARLRRTGLDPLSYRRIVRELLLQDTLAQRSRPEKVTLSPRAYDWIEEVTAEWVTYVQDSGIHVVGDLEDLRPRRPDAAERWRDPDRPRADRMADAALDALVALVLETASRPDGVHTPTARLGRAARRLLD
jgi:hypothetical protein